MGGIHTVALQLLNDGVAHGIVADDCDQRGLQAETRSGGERVGGVAPALELWEVMMGTVIEAGGCSTSSCWVRSFSSGRGKAATAAR